MGAINGVKKSSVVKKTSSASKSSTNTIIIVVLFTMVISMLLAVLGIILFWKYHYQAVYTNDVVMNIQAGQIRVYKATRDISAGEYIEGAVELVTIPPSIINDSLLGGSDNISNLKASGNILADSLITNVNTFDPKLQTTITNSTREYTIDYLKTPGVVAGDFIDIRIKTWISGDEKSYKDSVVASKIEILSKDDNGVIRIRLNEAELLNLNSAVIEVAGGTENRVKSGEIYVGKYTNPATQTKAAMTYDGKGITYTQEELLKAQEALRNEMLNEQNKGNNTGNTGNTGNNSNTGNTGNTGYTGNTENTENIENIANTETIENIENTSDIEGIENTSDIEGSDDSTVATGDTPDGTEGTEEDVEGGLD